MVRYYGLLRKWITTEDANRDTMTEYECSNCGEDWEGKSSMGYINPVCANCGTISTQAKVEK